MQKRELGAEMRKGLAVLLLAAPALCAQKWHFAALAGYGMAPAATANWGSEKADVGLKSGAVIGVAAGQELYERLGGEFRYLFRFSELKLAGRGTEVHFAGRSHLLHYDLLIFGRGGQAPVRPYLAVGGGARVYQGTGQEAAYQPLSQFAILTRTRQVTGMASLGGGLKVRVGQRSWIRWEFRDYLTPFPKTVIAPGRAAEIRGWVHDLTGLAAVGVSF